MDAQKSIGDIKWIHSTCGITNKDLEPPVPLLKGSNHANLLCDLTEKQQKALTQIVTNSFADHWSPAFPLSVAVLNREAHMMAILMQWDSQAKQPLKILERVFLLCNLNKSLIMQMEAVAKIMIKPRKLTLEITGMQPQDILPLTKDYLQWSLQNSDTLQWTLLNFPGLISTNFPSHKLFSLHPQVEDLPWLSRQPVEGLMVFTDAS